MVKVISDWERSGSGCGMLNILDDDDKQTQEQVYEFVYGDDKNTHFLALICIGLFHPKEHSIYTSDTIAEPCLTLESKSFSNLLALFLCCREMEF